MAIIKIFDPSRFDKYQKLAMCLCLLFFLILMIISQFHEMGGYGVETDFYGGYAINVDNILNGNRYHDEDHGPGYVFILTIFYFIFGDVFVAGKFLTIISSVLFIYFSFKVLKDLFNSKLAFFTVLLLSGVVFPYSILASTDMFFSFVFVLAAYLIFRKGIISYSNLIWGGLVAGYALMTRLNTVVLPIAVISSLLIINSENWDWSRRFKAILILLFTMLLTSSPWFVMNIIYYGKPFISEAHQTIGASFMGHVNTSGDFAWGAEKAVIAEKYDSLFSLIMGNFKTFLIFFLKNITLYFKLLLLMLIKFPAYLFLAPGAALLFSKIDKRQLSFFTIPVFGFLIYCIVTFIPRFYIYILPFLLLLIVYYFYHEDSPVNNESFKVKFKIINRVLFIIVILFLAKDSIKEMKKNITSEPLHLIKIAQILKQDSKESDIILTRKPHLVYLSNLVGKLIPDVDSIEALLDFAREKNATYIFYGIMEAKLRPGLKFLQDPQYVSPYLQLIYSRKIPKVFLYKIIPN